MKILAINLRPDGTQIVEGKIQKDKLIVERIDTTDSIYEILETFQQDSAEEFFGELSGHIKNKEAAAYFGISDHIVKKINCIEKDHVSPEEWNILVSSWLPQALQVEKDNFYLAAPLHYERKNKSVITGIAVPAAYISLIFKSAIAVKLKIRSIEPACFGLLRLINNWDSECCIMEIWEKTTSITGYSPIRGMFKINESVGWSGYLNAENGRDELLNNIARHDYTAYHTYKLANTDIPIYCVSDKFFQLRDLIKGSDVEARLQSLAQTPVNFWGLKNYENMDAKAGKLVGFAPAIGLALAPLQERMIKSADSIG